VSYPPRVLCPCGTGRPLEACCGPYLDGAPAPTAEALMRSRYSAYVLGNIDHVVRTQDADKDEVDRQAIEKFSKESDWQGLDIVATEAGGPDDQTELDLAEARYRANGMDPAAGLAIYERGEVHRLRGEFAEAEDSYRLASESGREPQPGLALLWLACGRTAAALGAVRRLLEERHDPVHRSQVLPAAVEVFVAGSDLAAAGGAADELDDLAASFETPPLTARAACARGALTLASGDAAGALSSLRRGWHLWQQLGARYDAARVRTLIGLAFRAMGDDDSAASELAVARRTFSDLGARADVQHVDALLAPSYPDGLTGREVEVLRLVAAGHTNPQIATALFLSEKTVARHLSNIFVKIDVSSRTAAATYAIEHRLV